MVVCGLEEYCEEAYRHLKDEKVYKKVLDNPLNKLLLSLMENWRIMLERVKSLRQI